MGGTYTHWKKGYLGLGTSGPEDPPFSHPPQYPISAFFSFQDPTFNLKSQISRKCKLFKSPSVQPFGLHTYTKMKDECPPLYQLGTSLLAANIPILSSLLSMLIELQLSSLSPTYSCFNITMWLQISLPLISSLICTWIFMSTSVGTLPMSPILCNIVLISWLSYSPPSVWNKMKK